MKYCRLSLLFLTLAMGYSTQAFADCKQGTSAISAPAITLNMTDMLNNNGSASWRLGTQYSGTFVCSPRPVFHRNSIGTSSPFTNNKLIVAFNNKKQFVEITINDLNPSGEIKFNESGGGTYSADKAYTEFTVNARLLGNTTSGNIMAVSGDTAYLDKALITMDTTDFSLINTIVRFATDLLTFLVTWRWPSHKEDIFYQPLYLIYNHTSTTCDFANAGLNVNLPQVNRTELLKGNYFGETPFTLNFTCKNILSGKPTRPIKAYLSSNHILSGDRKTLVDNNSSSARGIGVRILQDGSSTPVTFALSQSSPDGATFILDQQSNMPIAENIALNFKAYYHVFDANALSSGEIKATTIVNFIYE